MVYFENSFSFQDSIFQFYDRIFPVTEKMIKRTVFIILHKWIFVAQNPQKELKKMNWWTKSLVWLRTNIAQLISCLNNYIELFQEMNGNTVNRIHFNRIKLIFWIGLVFSPKTDYRDESDCLSEPFNWRNIKQHEIAVFT